MSRSGSSVPALIVRHTGQVFPLTHTPIRIGRNPDNTIVLADPLVSGRHAVITWEAGSHRVQDLGSSNGTYLDERRIGGPAVLRAGSVLRMGNTLFELGTAPVAGLAEPPDEPPPAPAGELGAAEPPPASRSALPTALGAALAAIILFCLGATITVVWLSLRGGEPVVTFQSPAPGESLVAGQEILLQAAASGARNISRLELRVDGVLVATATSSDPRGQPYLTISQRWGFAEEGVHSVSATAFTARGDAGAPATLDVAVAARATPPPADQTPVPPVPTPTPSIPAPTALPSDTPTATAEPSPTAAPTAIPSPTPTNTPTPTPTPTLIPPPAISFFRANPQTIAPGECAQLEWGLVTDATSASIDQGIGGVGTPGSQQVCPAQTTSYVMTAVGPGGITTASATVTVSGPTVVTATLTSESALDGYVIGGQAPYDSLDVRAGNIATASEERVYRGFLSFDLSGIPPGANIATARLRFFQVEVIGDPYGKLGQLALAHVEYGAGLELEDFDGPVFESVVLASQPLPGTWHVVADTPVRAWVSQDLAAGRSRFQVRLQFAVETDDGTTSDYTRVESGDNPFGTGNLPQLIVAYEP